MHPNVNHVFLWSHLSLKYDTTLQP